MIDTTLDTHWNFSGSYRPEDVIFLLRPLDIDILDIDEKERRIRQQDSHYSSMLSKEALPDADTIAIYEHTLERNGLKVFQACLLLARDLVSEMHDDITIVSLARAGTPIGILVTRILKDIFHIKATHYSISALRDIGVDPVALEWLSNKITDTSRVAFIDGWTGKGVISDTLKKSIDDFNLLHKKDFPSYLWCLSDLAGSAYKSASYDDWLIPSALLNSTVSGLISRTVWRADLVQVDQFHACKWLTEFEPFDYSNSFINRIMSLGTTELIRTTLLQKMPTCPVEHRASSKSIIKCVAEQLGIHDVNYIKPGLGESTRVLLRRQPDHVYIRDKEALDCQHLIRLCFLKACPITYKPDLPYQAIAIIKSKD
jgi:hypothetical protein